jgi:hypothetical protein
MSLLSRTLSTGPSTQPLNGGLPAYEPAPSGGFGSLPPPPSTNGLSLPAGGSSLRQNQSTRKSGGGMSDLAKLAAAVIALLAAGGIGLYAVKSEWPELLAQYTPDSGEPEPVIPTIPSPAPVIQANPPGPVPVIAGQSNGLPPRTTPQLPTPTPVVINPAPTPPPEIRAPEPATAMEVEPMVATAPPPRAEPLEEVQAPVRMVTPPAVTNEPLVEIGRSTVTPQMVPSDPVPAVNSPVVSASLPPECQPALDSLKQFLAAPNWQERLKHTQLATSMESKVQLYYASNPDGPVEVDSIDYFRHDTKPEVGKHMQVIFVLKNRAWSYDDGFPVMVEQTPEGGKVDWLTFVEFKDDILNRYLSNYVAEPGRFHVAIRRSHYFEDDVPNREDKDVFEIVPPMGNCNGYVFVPKGSPLARSLNTTISWDKEMSFGVVQLQWRQEGQSRWIELTALPRLNWYSSGEEAE